MEELLQYFPQTVTNHNQFLGRGEEGNVLRIGINSNSPMAGLLGGGVFATATCSAMGQVAGFNWSIFSSNDVRAFGETGIATYTVNAEEMYMHITLQEDVLWHDGTPLTLGDLVFAHEVIAHPDYTGAHWTLWNQSVRGALEYHRGESHYISGLVLSVDKRELTIYFDYMPISTKYSSLAKLYTLPHLMTFLQVHPCWTAS
ncbi:MAG: hypothetical protein FWE21_06040 [Defluviitaleaceae bacterium]|nr:hypothetical protein [Defluviitaleaceae bacterium]